MDKIILGSCIKSVISKKIALLVLIFVLGQAAVILISYIVTRCHLHEEIMRKVEYASEKEMNSLAGNS